MNITHIAAISLGFFLGLVFDFFTIHRRWKNETLRQMSEALWEEMLRTYSEDYPEVSAWLVANAPENVLGAMVTLQTQFEVMHRRIVELEKQTKKENSP